MNRPAEGQHPTSNRKLTAAILFLLLSFAIPCSIGILAQSRPAADATPVSGTTGGTAQYPPEHRVQIPHPAPPRPVAAADPRPAPGKGKPGTTGTPAKSTSTQVKVAVAPPPASAKPSAAGGSSGAVEFTVVLDTVFSNKGSSAVSSGQVSIPLLSVSQSRSQVIVSETIVPAPSTVSVDDLGNRSGTFDLGGIAPGETLVISQTYRLRIWGSGGSGVNGPTTNLHLAAVDKVEADAPEIAALAKSLTAGKETVIAKLDALFDYTREALRYDSKSPAKNEGALAALRAGSGVCEEYASLFVALCRASGIPSRVVNGFGRDYATAKAAWADGADLRVYRHAWAEAWVPGYGWATFDPTFNKAAISGVAARGIGSGTLILDNYGDKSILGKYAGGKLEVQRRQRLWW